MPKKTLNDILAEEDELGLLSNLKPASAPVATEHQRARQKLEDVNVFIDRHKRLPGQLPPGQKVSPSEKMLQFALNGLKSDVNVLDVLRPFDRHRLLTAAEDTPPPPTSIDDILASDDELLTTAADGIFVFEHAPSSKAKTDRKAERKTCADFASYKPVFDACVADLESGRRRTREFRREQEIDAGEFFILNGSLVFVAEVNEPHIRSGKANARLRLIFDNGTESDNLLRSLAAELYKDGPAGRGRRVTSAEAGPLFDEKAGTRVQGVASADLSQGDVLPDDKLAGCIYIVRSLSSDPEITKLDGHLYKIGFTSGDVQSRISVAKDDPTFLLAPVHPVKTFMVYNLNTAKMENLLHRFFGEARLDISIKDRFGKPFKPREWFLVPLEIVEEAVRRLIDGSIVRYQFDMKTGRIVERD